MVDAGPRSLLGLCSSEIGYSCRQLQSRRIPLVGCCVYGGQPKSAVPTSPALNECVTLALAMTVASIAYYRPEWEWVLECIGDSWFFTSAPSNSLLECLGDMVHIGHSALVG